MKDLDREVERGKQSFWSWYPTFRRGHEGSLDEESLKALARVAFMSGWLRRSEKRPAPREWR